MKRFIIICVLLLATTVSASTHTTNPTIMTNVQKYIDDSTVVLIGSYKSMTQSESFESSMRGGCQKEVTLPDGPVSLVEVDCPQTPSEYTVHFQTVEGTKGDANAFEGTFPGGRLTETGSEIQITLPDKATASAFIDQPFSVLFLTKTFLDRGNSDPSLAPATDWKILRSAGAYNFSTLEEAQAFLNGVPSKPTDVTPSNNDKSTNTDTPSDIDTHKEDVPDSPAITTEVTPPSSWLQSVWQWLTAPFKWI